MKILYEAYKEGMISNEEGQEILNLMIDDDRRIFEEDFDQIIYEFENKTGRIL